MAVIDLLTPTQRKQLGLDPDKLEITLQFTLVPGKFPRITVMTPKHVDPGFAEELMAMVKSFNDFATGTLVICGRADGFTVSGQLSDADVQTIAGWVWGKIKAHVRDFFEVLQLEFDNLPDPEAGLSEDAHDAPHRWVGELMHQIVVLIDMQDQPMVASKVVPLSRPPVARRYTPPKSDLESLDLLGDDEDEGDW